MKRPTAHRAFVVHAEAAAAEPEPVRVLGIDETGRGRLAWRRDPATGRTAASRTFTPSLAPDDPRGARCPREDNTAGRGGPG